jgi:hypothetical protein
MFLHNLKTDFITSGASFPEWVQPTTEGEGSGFIAAGFCLFHLLHFVIFN